MPTQSPYNLRCEWALPGLLSLAPISDLLIIVDVLSFSTAVDIATARHAQILPYPHNDPSAKTFADAHHALLASPRDTPNAFTLSPASLQNIPANTKLVLPSPNGSTLSRAPRAASTTNTTTICACLRNAAAVAHYAAAHATNISLIPAGERWPDHSLRPALEDLIGAGAILSQLPGSKSPEAAAAIAAFQLAAPSLHETLLATTSGQELLARNFPTDILLASQLNISTAIPLLQNETYINAATSLT